MSRFFRLRRFAPTIGNLKAEDFNGVKTHPRAASSFQAAFCKENIMIIWQTVIALILLLVIYGIITARRETKRQERIRAQALPAVQGAVKIHHDMRYQIKMSGGQRFDNVAIIGQIHSEDNPFGGWDGLFVLRFADNRRAFVRQGSVRYILEMTAA